MRLLALVLVAALGSGCVGASLLSADLTEPLRVDLPVVRAATNFYNVSGEPSSTKYLGLLSAEPFHSLNEIAAHFEEWNASHPGLIEVRVLGASIEGRPIWDVVLTNEARPGPKPVMLFDGGHHGNELAGIEAALYNIDFLLANYETNATVRGWVDAVEIHTVPVVNPDGYAVSSRGNALGVNLNRNYDLDWGNPLGASNPVMGTLAHTTGEPMPSISIVAENCGSGPFSEPETQAMRALLDVIGPRLVGYLTYHTPTNALAAPWSAYNAPFPLAPEQDALIEHVLAWTRENTDYRAGKAQWGNFSAGLPYAASGSSQDYVFATYQVPAFTLEVEIWYTSIQSHRYPERVFLEPYAGLAHWMEASLPISMYMLANWEALAEWRLPEAAPPLPEGVPPAPVPAAIRSTLHSPGEHEGAPTDPSHLPGILG